VAGFAGALLLFRRIWLLIGLSGVLLHALIHFAKAIFDAPGSPVNWENEIENEPVAQVTHKNEEKKT
jgi:hypothetical protein